MKLNNLKIDKAYKWFLIRSQVMQFLRPRNRCPSIRITFCSGVVSFYVMRDRFEGGNSDRGILGNIYWVVGGVGLQIVFKHDLMGMRMGDTRGVKQFKKNIGDVGCTVSRPKSPICPIT